LQAGPATNKELMDRGGFRFGARVDELRKAGHAIRCEALGPTKGCRTYTLEIPAGRGGTEVIIGEPPPGADLFGQERL
jgi:hypothetical protein